MKRPILDEEALEERKRGRKKAHMLGARPKAGPDKRKWTAAAVLLTVLLVIGFGYIFTRSCSAIPSDDAETKPAADPT